MSCHCWCLLSDELNPAVDLTEPERKSDLVLPKLSKLAALLDGAAGPALLSFFLPNKPISFALPAQRIPSIHCIAANSAEAGPNAKIIRPVVVSKFLRPRIGISFCGIP